MGRDVVGAAVDAYDRHVGRYGPELAREMVRVSGVEPRQLALDVSCGTGALTIALADLLGARMVAAIDPSERFVAACQAHAPHSDVRVGTGEDLPWDAALEVDAELARSFGADKPDPFSRPPELERLWRSAGLERVELGRLEAGAEYDDFDDLWYPFANGVGSLGRFYEALDEPGRASFKARRPTRVAGWALPPGSDRLLRVWDCSVEVTLAGCRGVRGRGLEPRV